jgi:hypothetical protein
MGAETMSLIRAGEHRVERLVNCPTQLWIRNRNQLVRSPRSTGKFRAWLAAANTWTRQVLGCTPAGWIAASRQAMLALPLVAQETGWRSRTGWPGSRRAAGCQRLLGSPWVVDRRIEVTADLALMRALCEGRVVVGHERSWAGHKFFTGPPTRPPPRRCADGEWRRCAVLLNRDRGADAESGQRSPQPAARPERACNNQVTGTDPRTSHLHSVPRCACR